MTVRKKRTYLKSDKNEVQKEVKSSSVSKKFHIDFKNEAQSLAWAAFQKHDILFLTGCPGTGKTYLAAAFALEQILNKKRNKIILTRPIVEAGESLGFLPGTFDEKVAPYMMPIMDCIDTIAGKEGPFRERVNQSIEVAPIAFMRGRTFENAVCIFDEAQNATLSQIKLFLTRFGQNSKIIVTGDPTQSDLPGKVALVEVMQKLKGVEGIGIFEFKAGSIVRHPLISKIIEKI